MFVRLTLQRDGKVQNPTVAHGDPAFCAKIISALKEAQIPPAPDEETYQTFNNAVVDFRP